MKLFRYKWFKKQNRLTCYMNDIVAYTCIGLMVWLVYMHYLYGGNYSTGQLALWCIGFFVCLLLAISLSGAAHREKLSDRIERLEAK